MQSESKTICTQNIDAEMMKVGKKEAFQITAKTHGYITKEIELEQIYQFILKFFDPEAKVNRYENRFGESNEMAVYFTYKGEERRLFTMVYKSRKFSKNGEKNRLVFLDLDYWGHSVEIMRSILSYFSGWLDENDCDMEDLEYILEEILNIVDEEQPDGVTPNIIKITRKELNRRLGGMVVIIEDDEEEK